MLNDAALFRFWGPRCSGKSAAVQLFGRGVVTVAPAIIDAVRALNACLIAFHYLTRASDTGAFNCRQKVGGNGWSIHSLKIALDINWTTNPYGRRLVTDFPPAMRDAIKAIRTNNGATVWAWGGDWDGNKDAMHWQIACTPRDLATGINPATLPGSVAPPPAAVAHPPAVVAPATPPPAPTPGDDDDMNLFVKLTDQVGPYPPGALFRITNETWCHLATQNEVDAEQRIAKLAGQPTDFSDISGSDLVAYATHRSDVRAVNAAATR